MKHKEKIEEIRSKVAKMTNEELCTIVVDHADWYREYADNGLYEDDSYYAVMTEVLIIEEAANRLNALDKSSK